MSELNEKLEKIKLSKENILNKNFKVLFFMIQPDTACASVIEIYNHVKILKGLGYDAQILTDTDEYTVPEWLDDDLKVLPHISSKSNFNISVEDFLIIPEIFTNVMEQITQLNCGKVVLLQSYENGLKGLLPGEQWGDKYGIVNVITTNENLTEFVKTNMSQNYDVKNYTVGIPDYFKSSNKPKDLIISFLARNPQEASKVLKMFYLKYPHYRFVSFEDLRPTKRTEFAEKMSKSAATLWIDRIASLGTTPIEAMKCGSVPIGFIPDLRPEYITEKNGYWTNDILQMPTLIANFVEDFIQDKIDDSFYVEMKETASKYGIENSNKSIQETYQYFFNKRVSEFNKYLEPVKPIETV